jgi:hypothetical protein
MPTSGYLKKKVCTERSYTLSSYGLSAPLVKVQDYSPAFAIAVQNVCTRNGFSISGIGLAHAVSRSIAAFSIGRVPFMSMRSHWQKVRWQSDIAIHT